MYPNARDQYKIADDIKSSVVLINHTPQQSRIALMNFYGKHTRVSYLPDAVHEIFRCIFWTFKVVLLISTFKWHIFF